MGTRAGFFFITVTSEGNLIMRIINRVICTIISMFLFASLVQAQHKYIGAKMCSMCHKTEKQGNQLGIWEKSPHAKAYKTLLTAKAEEYAKARGLTKAAAESPECLECHTVGKTVDAKLFEKAFDLKDGVQCETCHGPGSDYKSITTMKDETKAVAAGMRVYKDEAEIEKMCRSCHNEKSPGFKEFIFKERWAKIKHLVPKGG